MEKKYADAINLLRDACNSVGELGKEVCPMYGVACCDAKCYFRNTTAYTPSEWPELPKWTETDKEHARAVMTLGFKVVSKDMIGNIIFYHEKGDVCSLLAETGILPSMQSNRRHILLSDIVEKQI